MARLQAQSNGVGLVKGRLGRVLQLEGREHVLRLVEGLERFLVEDVLVGDLLVVGRRYWGGLSLRPGRHPG